MTQDTPNTGVRQFWIVKWTSRPGAITKFKIFTKTGTMLTYVAHMDKNLKIPFQVLYASTISMELRDITPTMRTEAILHVPTDEERAYLGGPTIESEEESAQTNEEHNNSKAT